MSAPEQSADGEIDFDAYRRFVEQVGLRDIWLVNSKTVNKYGASMPDDGVGIALVEEPSWVDLDDGFCAFSHYRVSFKRKNKIVASVEATFAADFASDTPMTAEFFQAFAEHSLPINTWPYLREFLSSMLGRMGWIPFTLPSRRVVADMETP